MAEQKGFFRRIFTFGQDDSAKPAEIAPAETVPAEVAPSDAAPAEPIEAEAPAVADDDDFAFLEEPGVPDAEPESDFGWLRQDAPDAEAVEEAEATLIEEDGGLPAPEPVVEAAPESVSVEEMELLPEEEEADGSFAWLDEPVEPEDEAELDGGEPDQPGWRVVEAKQAAAGAALAAEPARSWFQRLADGLSRSSGQLSGQITSLFTKRRLDEDTLQDFEDVLIQADLGVETATRITGRLSDGRYGREITGEAVRAILAEEVERSLAPVARPLELDLSVKPHVILVVGVNGTGKTTTIGKLAAKLTRGGLKVTLAAGDTFRAAAVEQLKIWGERTGSAVIARDIGADAAGLAFEAYDEALRNGSDVLIIDTAGRLQNRTELMAELEKIVRVLRKRAPDAPHTVLQTLDATTGQNAMNQVEIFRNVAGVNGLVMTKLDGTARGGILVAIATRHALPVYFIGVGEGIDDLEPFKARDFAEAIAGRAA
ncbi:signal recognition particle-docking protein FtsY [Aureimonas altamirensis]|uniref:signal recognition particle-docking protein FtsY n=1 Tax=Aureimonas altamirensis TaxID=370622 RepID=UPI0020369AA7|nr:signal recognition particle-docking protein FtsY [Aureimonas altamirensis]MCM2502436.1 signal recognition particle-docking protein FtsY [Aureimonas altamirensis]